MKAFYALFLLVFLASCGSDVAETVVTPSESTAEETSAEIDWEIMEIPEEVMMEDTAMVESESKVEVLDAAYTNPKWPVDMEIEYALDANGTIESIDVSATTYDVSGFNSAVQDVVGMTLEEASDTYVSGSSLTSAAFNSALKWAM